MMAKICGHRGAANHKPENTISGFEWCVENKIDWAECDVQLTNENTLLIMGLTINYINFEYIKLVKVFYCSRFFLGRGLLLF